MMQRSGLFETFKATAWRFASDRSGAVAMEYIVTAAIIAAGVAAGVAVLSDSVAELYSRVNAVFTE